MKLLKIKKSKIDNNGLYANCNIKKGTKIGLINMVSFLAEDPNIKNLIICSQDW